MNLSEIAQLLNERYKENSAIGNTTLADIGKNAADPLVSLMVPALQGLLKLDQKLETIIANLSPLTAEGDYLDLTGELMGRPRKQDFKSVAPIVIVGMANTQVIGGTGLIDSQGREWETLKTVIINSDGLAYVNAASKDNGSFDLYNGELKLIESIEGVGRATNSAAPQLGGTIESDEDYRRRLLNVRPNWQVKESTSAVVTALYGVDGVVRADVTENPETECPMVVVLGGEDDEIANTIYSNAPYSSSILTGSHSGVVGCHSVNFQRMCPVVIRLRLWTDCNCSSQTEAEAIAEILTQAPIWAQSRNGLTIKDVLCRSKRFIKAEMKSEGIPLIMCAKDAYDITNPATGASVTWGSIKTSGLCCGVICNSNEWTQSVELLPYQYPIVVEDYIEVINECSEAAPAQCGGCGL